jgi:NADH dehydrogenase FAD-containing subunit
MIVQVKRRPRKKRILVLGGGFGGVYTAIHLEKLLARESGIEICLVSRDNFFLFTPMLHEIAASDLEITNIVNPLRKLIRNLGKSHPPTAQHAMREGKVVAQNIAPALFGRPQKSFSFKTIGLLASIGRRTGVARILGFNFSGFFAWWMWRTIYLSKLPGLDKKIRVAFDWTLDLLFPKDACAVHDLSRRRDFHRPEQAMDMVINHNHYQSSLPQVALSSAEK